MSGSDNINNFCLCLQNKHAKLCLPITFQISDTEVLIQKFQLNIHLTKSSKRDHNFKLCLYTLKERIQSLITTF